MYSGAGPTVEPGSEFAIGDLRLSALTAICIAGRLFFNQASPEETKQQGNVPALAPRMSENLVQLPNTVVCLYARTQVSTTVCLFFFLPFLWMRSSDVNG